jgi:hypothetical protein
MSEEAREWLQGRDGKIFMTSMHEIVRLPDDLETAEVTWSLSTSGYSLHVGAWHNGACGEREFGQGKLDSWRRQAEIVLTSPVGSTLQGLNDELHPAAHDYFISKDAPKLIDTFKGDSDDIQLLKYFCIYLHVMLECLNRMKKAAQCGFSRLKFSKMTLPMLIQNVQAFPIFDLPDRKTTDREVQLGWSSVDVTRLGAILQDRPGYCASPFDPRFIAYRFKIRLYISHLLSFMATDNYIRFCTNEFMFGKVLPCPSLNTADVWSYRCMDPSLLGRDFTEFCQLKSHRGLRMQSLLEVDLAFREKGGLGDWLTSYFEERSLLFVDVPAPAHCYHAVYPLFLALGVDGRLWDFRKIIFCTADGSFEHRLQLLSKVRSEEVLQNRPVYFILHPESLCREEFALLKDFVLLTRQRIERRANVYPRVIVISSLSADDFEIPLTEPVAEQPVIKWNNEKLPFLGPNNTLSLSRGLIRLFSWLTARARVASDVQVDVVVFRSERVGLGKTHRILDLLKKYNQEDKNTSARL